MSHRNSAGRAALRTALIMVVFTLAFTTLMSTTYRVTSPAIAESERQERKRLINAILPADSYDNELLEDYVEVGPEPELGIRDSGRVYRARAGDEPKALVLEAVAPDGYGGRIHLAVAVSVDARVLGVRVTDHDETPGLGDYIDPERDRNRESPWIEQFSGQSVEEVPLSDWRVERDGGIFTYRAGATISARAVTDATRRALSFALDNRDALFEAESGTRL